MGDTGKEQNIELKELKLEEKIKRQNKNTKNSFTNHVTFLNQD